MNKNDIYVTYCLHRGKTGLFHTGKWVVVPFKYYRGYICDGSNFPRFYFKKNALKYIKLMNEAAKWGLQEGRMEVYTEKNDETM